MTTELFHTAGTTDGVNVVLRTQAPTDVAKLAAVLPKDQTRLYRAKWVDANVVFEPFDPAKVSDAPPVDEAVDAEIARLTALPDEELQTIAAEKGIRWSAKASKETMIEKIARAA